MWLVTPYIYQFMHEKCSQISTRQANNDGDGEAYQESHKDECKMSFVECVQTHLNRPIDSHHTQYSTLIDSVTYKTSAAQFY